MKVLSLFSGVGGFDLGLERAGMQTVFQCEWDKHATRILERHWPNIPRWDDVSTLTGKHILQHAPVIDVVAWGSPCQDLSVAGKRTGLDGSRSGLFHEGIRIIKELQEETNGKYPRISLWENVYGALSSNKGADFGVILDEMAEAGALVQEWRVLDAQYFGVPQRRRRVFLVSIFDSATAARCRNPLLPVSQSVRRDTETSGTERQEPAGTTTHSFGNSGFQQWRETDTAVTLSTRDHKGSMTLAVEQTRLLGSEIVGSLNAVDYKWPQNQQLDENKFIPVETFTKAKRAQSTTDNETWVEGKPAPTLNAFDQGDTRATTVVVGEERTYRNVTGALLGRDSFGPNHEGARDGKLILEPMLSFDTQFGSNANVFENHATTLKASQAAPSVAIPIQDGRDIEKHQNGLGIGEEGAPSYTLDQTGAQAIAYSIREDAKANTFSATELDRSNALSALRPSPQSHHAQMFIAEPTMAVRRLTPIECERLMGWPDNWTEGQADTHRYKQCGNGVASPVATWIAQHLQQLDKDTNATPTQTPTT